MKMRLETTQSALRDLDAVRLEARLRAANVLRSRGLLGRTDPIGSKVAQDVAREFIAKVESTTEQIRASGIEGAPLASQEAYAKAFVDEIKQLAGL